MSAQAVIGDLNNDGIPDLVWSSGRSNGDIWVFLGNGDGTFQIAKGFEAHASGSKKLLAIADLNHDGKLDIVVGAENFIEISLGKGDGTMQDGMQIPVDIAHFDPGYGQEIFVADLNGDGKLDIARSNVVILGNGDGTFQPVRYLLTASPGSTSQACVDLNHDGLPDLVYVDYDQTITASTLSILFNDTPGPSSSVLGYSAATGVGRVAPLSISSVYGNKLAHTIDVSTGAMPPTQLGGISLQVRDASGTVQLAPLFYVSPAQINFLVPNQTVVGPIVLTIEDGLGQVGETANATSVTTIAPGIFTANGQGQGAAAATAVQILANGSQQPVAVFRCSGPDNCGTVPIDLSGGQPVYLSLYGTGFRGTASPELTTCTVGGTNARVQFVGAQRVFPGLDQINILLPKTLASGALPVQCRFESSVAPGYGSATTNPVQIEIK